MSREKGYRQYSTWMNRGHSGRRRFLQGMALSATGLAVAAMTGCGRKERPAVPGAGPAVEQVRRGGTLRWHTFSVRAPYDRGLDPHVVPAVESGRMRLFYQTLVRANPRTWQVEPELAQRWEQPSPTEIILTLTPGVKFHDKPPANGRDLKVEDVIYSLERARSPGPEFAVRSLLDSVDKIEAVDASRVRLTLKLVDAGMLDKLTAFSLAVLAPEVVEKAGGKFASADIVVGTGPFVLTEFSDVSATHVRNPAYWKTGLPYLDQVLATAFGDEEARWAAFRAGGLDLLDTVPGPEARKYSTQQGQILIDGRFPAEWAAASVLLMFFVNVTRPPLNDPRIFKALRLLIDYQEVVTTEQEISSGRSYLSQAFPSALAAWDFSQEEYVTTFLPWKRPKDEAAKVARDLLSAAGFTPDRPLTLTLATSTDQSYRVRGQLLQAQWRRLSQGAVQAEIRLFIPAQVLGVAARREYETWLHGAAPPIGEPDAALRTFYHSKGSRSYAGWVDPRTDNLIDQQRATLQVEQRKAVIKELLRHLIENAPAVVWAGSYSLSAAQPRVKGWAPQADAWASAFQYETVWLET